MLCNIVSYALQMYVCYAYNGEHTIDIQWTNRCIVDIVTDMYF